jgi:hypothetical protein
MRRIVCLAVLVGAAVAMSGAGPAGASSGSSLRQTVAAHLKAPWLSLGAQAWLNPPRASSDGTPRNPGASVSFGTNVDAANPNEDQLSGQAETAIAAASSGRVMDDWNDATGFAYFAGNSLKASLTGVGYSTNSGKTFTDLVGLQNPNADQQWSGDPSMVSIDGGAHFIAGSLYFPSLDACADGKPAYATIAVEVLTPTPFGTVDMGNPVIVSKSGNVCTLGFPNGDPNTALLDKDFLSWDQSSRTLVMSFTRFYLDGNHTGQGEIDIARAHVPADPTQLAAGSFHTIMVWPEQFEENEGAYATVAPGGNTYVAWERNLDTNQFDNDPYIYEHIALVPAGATAPSIGGISRPVVFTHGQVNSTPAGGVKSMDSTLIAGYNRGTGNDFPRIAWDATLGRVVVAWNDASAHPLGDIWIRTLGPGLQGPSKIARANSDADFTLHFLPALSVRSNGAICTSWYDRRNGGPDSALTDLYGECRSSLSTQAPDFRITTGPTDWTNTSSLITPNFGDYTDNTSVGTRTYYTWSDGRIGVPQPFVDHHG